MSVLDRMHMVDDLLNDFRTMFPESSKEERELLRVKLYFFEDEELRLLHGQLSK